MPQKRFFNAALFVLTLALCLGGLAACGGSSSSSDPTPPPPPSSNWGELEWGTGSWSN